jgi:protein O-GlcNAc transferase
MDTLFQTAVTHYQLGNLQAAQAILEAIGAQPDALHLLGILHIRQARYEAAIMSLERAISINFDVADYHYQLGIAHAQQKEWVNAVKYFRHSIRLQPGLAVAHNNLGMMLKELEHIDEAAREFQYAIQLKPDYAIAHQNLGNIFLQQKQFALAEQCYRNALMLRPESADTQHNLALVLEHMGRLDEAAACYLALLSGGDRMYSTYNNLGNIYAHQDKLADALDMLYKALELNTEAAETHCNLGYVFVMQGNLGAAVQSLERAIALQPNLSMAYLNLSGALCGLGDHEAATHCIRHAMAMHTDNSEIHGNLLFVSQFLHALPPATLLDEHLQFARRFELPHRAAWSPHSNIADPAKRLKIGYVSADFRSHAVAAFIEPVLANHNRGRFEIFCYYNHAKHDAVTARLIGLSDHWFSCVGVADDELAERIRSDGIDLLVDLSGHTGGSRLLSFVRKPAPVQLTYLGYPGTTGLSSIDYRITDGYADPVGSEMFYTEKLLRLPDSLCCYRPPEAMPEIAPLPALKNGYLTFGSFNNSSKIDLSAIALWSKILLALPNSRLLMVTIPEGDRRERIAQQFEQAGVLRSRIDFYGVLPAREFHALFMQVDLALDPLLVTGGTTTCESLWMGVPVIVLRGERFIHRVGYSFLCSAGLARFAAASIDEYVQIAVNAAADIEGLAQLRLGLRAQLACSALMDQQRFTRNLEQLYRDAWRIWCSSKEHSDCVPALR